MYGRQSAWEGDARRHVLVAAKFKGGERASELRVSSMATRSHRDHGSGSLSDSRKGVLRLVDPDEQHRADDFSQTAAFRTYRRRARRRRAGDWKRWCVRERSVEDAQHRRWSCGLISGHHARERRRDVCSHRCSSWPVQARLMRERSGIASSTASTYSLRHSARRLLRRMPLGVIAPARPARRPRTALVSAC